MCCKKVFNKDKNLYIENDDDVKQMNIRNACIL